MKFSEYYSDTQARQLEEVSNETSKCLDIVKAVHGSTNIEELKDQARLSNEHVLKVRFLG